MNYSILFLLYRWLIAVNFNFISFSPIIYLFINFVLIDEKEKGTQIKILAVLADGTDVLVKPMR